MSNSNRYFKLGVFVLGGIAVLVALALLLGSGRFTRNRFTIETYFNESVQGLDVGSKVKYRGVSVGEVTRITFTNTKYQLDKPPTERLQYVLVEASVQSQLVGGRLAMQSERRDLIKAQVDKGLRIKLTAQGLTGTNYLEIDFADPNSNPLLPFEWDPEYLYVPSAPSTVTQFVNAVEEVLDKFKGVDIAGTLVGLNELIATTNQRVQQLPIEQIGKEAVALISELRASNRQLSRTLASLPLERIGQDARGLIAEVRESNQRLQKFLGDPAWQSIPADAQAAVARAKELFDNPELGRSLNRLQRTLGRLDHLIAGHEGDIGVTLENLRAISDNLRDVSETVKRYPSQLILGAPPAPVNAQTAP